MKNEIEMWFPDLIGPSSCNELYTLVFIIAGSMHEATWIKALVCRGTVFLQQRTLFPQFQLHIIISKYKCTLRFNKRTMMWSFHLIYNGFQGCERFSKVVRSTGYETKRCGDKSHSWQFTVYQLRHYLKTWCSAPPQLWHLRPPRPPRSALPTGQLWWCRAGQRPPAVPLPSPGQSVNRSEGNRLVVSNAQFRDDSR